MVCKTAKTFWHNCYMAKCFDKKNVKSEIQKYIHNIKISVVWCTL